jgi:hypothetical protein
MSAFANRQECNDGNTRTCTSCPQSMRSPPDTGQHCDGSTPFSRITRMLSYEPTIGAPVLFATVSAPSR